MLGWMGLVVVAVVDLLMMVVEELVAAAAMALSSSGSRAQRQHRSKSSDGLILIVIMFFPISLARALCASARYGAADGGRTPLTSALLFRLAFHCMFQLYVVSALCFCTVLRRTVEILCSMIP